MFTPNSADIWRAVWVMGLGVTGLIGCQQIGQPAQMTFTCSDTAVAVHNALSGIEGYITVYQTHAMTLTNMQGYSVFGSSVPVTIDNETFRMFSYVSCTDLSACFSMPGLCPCSHPVSLTPVHIKRNVNRTWSKR